MECGHPIKDRSAGGNAGSSAEGVGSGESGDPLGALEDPLLIPPRDNDPVQANLYGPCCGPVA